MQTPFRKLERERERRKRGEWRYILESHPPLGRCSDAPWAAGVPPPVYPTDSPSSAPASSHSSLSWSPSDDNPRPSSPSKWPLRTFLFCTKSQPVSKFNNFIGPTRIWAYSLNTGPSVGFGTGRRSDPQFNRDQEELDPKFSWVTYFDPKIFTDRSSIQQYLGGRDLHIFMIN